MEYNWDDCPEVSPVAKHFIAGLLLKDPKKRMTAETALLHPFMKLGEEIPNAVTAASGNKNMLTSLRDYNFSRKSSKTSFDDLNKAKNKSP